MRRCGEGGFTYLTFQYGLNVIILSLPIFLKALLLQKPVSNGAFQCLVPLAAGWRCRPAGLKVKKQAVEVSLVFSRLYLDIQLILVHTARRLMAASLFTSSFYLMHSGRLKISSYIVFPVLIFLSILPVAKSHYYVINSLSVCFCLNI